MNRNDDEVSACGVVGALVAGGGRRRWPEALKRQLVATLEAGQSVSVVARRHDVNANQLFKWRRQMLADAPPTGGRPPVAAGLLPVTVVAAPAGGGIDGRRDGLDRELGASRHVRVEGPVDPALVRVVLEVLAGPGAADDRAAGGRGCGWRWAGPTCARGFGGLALVVQETLKRDPHGGHLFVFRGPPR